MGEKVCGACRQTKPLTAFHCGGEARRCIPCQKSYQRSYYLSNQERIKAKSAAWAAANPERKAQVNKTYRSANKERCAANAKAWSDANLDRRLAASTKYRATNLEKARSNEAAYRERNREICNARVSAWKVLNPHKAVHYFHKRRAAELQATPAWADFSAIEAVYARAQELRDAEGRAFHVDHIVPLISPLVCGLHCEANLEPVPPSVNLRKNNRRWPDMP